MTRPSVGLLLGRPDRNRFLAESLRRLGFPVTRYESPRAAAEDVEEVESVPETMLPILARILRSEERVFVASLGLVAPTSLYLNRRFLRRTPYLYVANGLKWEYFADRARRRPFPRLFERVIYPGLLDRAFAGASKILCNSRFLERAIARRYPRHASRLTTVYNGIDFDRYAGGRPAGIPGVESRDRVVSCVTSIDFRNKATAVRLVIDAFERIRAERGDLKLVIAAKGANPRYREETEAYVASKTCRDSIVLLHNHPRIEDLLSRSELFLYATRDDSNDSLPRALLEAQAAGLAAVATATSGCPEIVLDGTTGSLVAYDASEMAARCLDLLDDADRRETMGREARRSVRDRFSWERMAEGYAREILEAVR